MARTAWKRWPLVVGGFVACRLASAALFVAGLAERTGSR